MQREIDNLKRKLHHDSKGNLVLGLTCPPTMKVTTTIDEDQGLPQVRPFPTKKNTIGGVGAEAHLLGAWETMP